VWVRTQTMPPYSSYGFLVFSRVTHHRRRFSRLVWQAVILLIAWLLGWGVFHVAGGLIHVLLVIAVIVFLINLISGRRTV
jgi:uncharacterized membrane protein YtjA (UPF0391 family)